MKGRYVITRHLHEKKLMEAIDYVCERNLPYQVLELRNRQKSISVCFESCDNPLREQCAFQDYIQ